MKYTFLILSLVALAAGCAGPHHKQSHHTYGGPPYGPAHDRPFPVGQVSDSHWETQQTNAEAADFIFYDHEFRFDTTKHVETAQLSPLAKKHLAEVALRLEHVPFPVVIEELPRNHDDAKNHEKGLLEQARRKTIVEQLNRLGVTNADERVVIANACAEGFTGVEGERSYFNIINGGFGGGAGRRFGGTGGAYR
ncbi:MAG: hypothetical protein K8R36_23605 [Planctomycetales bacterium]|nr:hypothetical protein [Planctomycetales bacterium]